MKKRFIVLFILALTVYTGSMTHHAFAQNSTTEKIATPNDKNYTGPMTEQDFMSGYTKGWFTRGYQAYTPSDKIVKKIKRNIKKYNIKVFMGTWCPDSRREIPKLFKLLNQAKFNQDQLTVYAVNHSKRTENNYKENLNIQRVPTIIFYNKKGEEVNRFVEHPVENLEKDILKIVSGQDYTDHSKLNH